MKKGRKVEMDSQERLFDDELIRSWITGELSNEEIDSVDKKSLVPFYDQIWV